jgi:hypothetical protein
MQVRQSWAIFQEGEAMPHEAVTLIIAILGAVLGLIGTVLSLLNTWRAFDRDRVKLRVVPKYAFPVGGSDNRPRVSIDVTNLSMFPVTVSQIGFLFHDSTNCGVLLQPIMLDGGTFPRRLEPRTSFSVMCDPTQHLEPAFASIRCAYVKTDCGVTVEGNSPALRQMVQAAKQCQHQRVRA